VLDIYMSKKIQCLKRFINDKNWMEDIII